MIPVELGETSWRRQTYYDTTNNANLQTELDIIQEIREKA